MKIKGILNYFRLSHIAWFFSGVVITVVFNWIVFKDPKRITAAGVSTLIAASAFLLALWSAFKVNKWLNTKINDAAFNQTLKIVEHIEKYHEFMEPLRAQLAGLPKATRIFDFHKFSEEEIKELNKNCQQAMAFCDRLTISVTMLKYWNAGLSKIGESYINEITEEILSIISIAKSIPNQKNAHDYDETIKKASNNYLNSYEEIKKIASSNYDNSFKHGKNPTSPLKNSS